MTSGGKLLLFLLLLPVLLAGGYDVSVNSKTPRGEIIPRIDTIDLEKFQASDLGYLMLKYTPTFYDMFKASVEPATWDQWINPVLQMNTYIVAGAPLALYVVWLLIALIFHVWPFNAEPRIKELPKHATERRLQGARFHFKRK